jgi:hypothetical protein
MPNRPDFKLVIKAKQRDAKPLTVLAAWRGERGLSASLDRDVARIVIERTDGSREVIQRAADGKPTHWLNVYEGGAAPVPVRHADSVRRSAVGSSAPLLDAAGDGGAVDDIPF